MVFKKSVKQQMKHLMVSLAGMAFMAVAFSGCHEGPVLMDEGSSDEGMLRAIGFDNTFIDQATATRAAAPVALSDYFTSMGVWGWSTSDGVTELPLFIDHLVSYSPTAAKWQYSPLRYWDRRSTYRFYAYAPHQTDAAGSSVTIDAATGHIAISGVTLTGTNLQTPPTAAQQYVFSAVPSGDTDWMMARAGRTGVPGRFGQTVEFTMQHILSKLNVAVRVSDALAADGGVTGVTVDSLHIGTFAAEGDFAQTLDHTPDATLAADRAAAEWTLTAAPALTLQGATDAIVKNIPVDPADTTVPGNTLLYILESLVLPQDVTASQTVKLVYTLHFSDGRNERYTHVMPLSNAFGPTTEAGGQLLSGYSYTLKFIIGPDVITFDPGVDEWTSSIDATKLVN